MHAISFLIIVTAAVACRVEHVRFVDSSAGQVAGAPASQACGITPATVITGNGIGALEVGLPLARAAASCRIASDTTLGGGADSVRLVHIDLLRDTVSVAVVHDTIRRIDVADSAFQTSDRFGVDTRVAKLLTLRDVEGRTEGGSLWVISPSHCGTQFRLEGPAPTPPAAQSGRAALRRLAGEERVDRVSITGCRAMP